MSSKDYIAIADIIRTARNRYQSSADGLPAISYIATELADYMAGDNHRFNRDLFLSASTSRVDNTKGGLFS